MSLATALLSLSLTTPHSWDGSVCSSLCWTTQAQGSAPQYCTCFLLLCNSCSLSYLHTQLLSTMTLSKISITMNTVAFIPMMTASQIFSKTTSNLTLIL